MNNNLIFIGGIHGVGKSTVCQEVCRKLNIIHLSASEVLKWKEINVDEKNKKVKDISATQDRLITGLNNILEADKRYMLDGHFCLFDSLSNVNKVPLETFSHIKPIIICNVIGDPEEISKRLNSRDGKKSETDQLEKMQTLEIEHGKYVAQKLHIPYIEVKNSNVEILEKEILNLK